MTSIYILKLESGKYYIGKSNDVNERFEQEMDHLLQKYINQLLLTKL